MSSGLKRRRMLWARRLRPFGDGCVVGAAAVVDDSGLGTLLFGVPDVLGDLEVSEDGAVGAFLRDSRKYMCLIIRL